MSRKQVIEETYPFRSTESVNTGGFIGSKKDKSTPSPQFELELVQTRLSAAIRERDEFKERAEFAEAEIGRLRDVMLSDGRVYHIVKDELSAIKKRVAEAHPVAIYGPPKNWVSGLTIYLDKKLAETMEYGKLYHFRLLREDAP